VSRHPLNYESTIFKPVVFQVLHTTFAVKMNMIQMYTNIQQDANYSILVLLRNHSTCFGHSPHPLYTYVENDVWNREYKMNMIVTRRNGTKEEDLFICSSFSQRLNTSPSKIRGFIIISTSSTALGPVKPSHQWVPPLLLGCVKRSDRKVLLPSIVVKNVWC
jgi:hypothetical protein